MQILQPAFQFNIIMQFSRAEISYIVPCVMTLISKWSRMEVINFYRNLCDLLILGFKRKFKDELESRVYSVAFY